MKILTFISIWFFAVCLHVQAAPMTFELVGSGGNCNGCEWIKAEGDITAETPLKFKNFQHVHNHSTIVLSSKGGSLNAGLQLGRLFRKIGVTTQIGRSVRSTDGQHEKIDGECNSACAYAFLGGKERLINDGSKLGFHQFFDPALLKDAEQEISTLEQQYNNARDQYISGVIVNYLVEMEIDTKLYRLASQIGPNDPIRFLTKQEAAEFLIDNSSDILGDWQIRAFGKGLLVEAKTTTSKRRLRLYCSKDGNHYLTYFIPLNSVSAEWQDYKNTFADNQNKVQLDADGTLINTKVAVIAPVKDADEMVIALELNGNQAKRIANAKSLFIPFTDTSLSRVEWSYYSIFSVDKLSGKPDAPMQVFRLCI